MCCSSDVSVDLISCVNQYDACEVVCGECEHGCDVCGNLDGFVHIVMHSVYICVNCVRNGIKNKGGSAQIFNFLNTNCRTKFQLQYVR